MRRAEKVRRDQIHRFPHRIYGHMAELAQEPEREYPVIFVEVERRCHSAKPRERLVFPALRIVPHRRQRIAALALRATPVEGRICEDPVIRIQGATEEFAVEHVLQC